MVDAAPQLVPPTVVVVGDIGAEAIASLERSGLSVRVADPRGEPHKGLILFDMRAQEQLLDARMPEQMDQLLDAAERARAFAEVVVVILSEFEETKEDRAAGLFVCRTFDAATLSRISRSAASGSGPVSSRHPPGGSNMIMVVEDDPDLRYSLASLLDDAGYEVATAAHGREALQELSSRARPDLVLLDMMMPVLDGWGFMAACKRDPALSSIPVVIVSAGSRALFEAAPGAIAYLEKPLDRDKLLKTIRACLEERRGAPAG